MAITYYKDLEQGTDEWDAIRRGKITASNVSKILTPAKLEMSKATGFLYDFCRQKIDDMPYGDFSTRHTERGHIEEKIALALYAEKQPDIERCGFVENDDHGFIIGCSPDALVGEEGGAEVKSFAPDKQFGNIIEEKIDPAHYMQVQFTLLCTGRKWWDFIHHSSGTHQIVTRVYPDLEKHEKMIVDCRAFDKRVKECLAIYREKIKDETRFTDTPYIAGLYDQPEEEMEI